MKKVRALLLDERHDFSPVDVRVENGKYEIVLRPYSLVYLTEQA